MPTILERGSRLLAETEAKLRELLSEAATSGDYASVVQIASWARSLSELSNRKIVDGTATVARSVKLPPKGPKATPITKRDRRSYPQFFRQGTQVVRIAWSKREKKEYQHKAPYGVLGSLVKAMTEKGAEGRVFTTDQLLPIRDAELSEIPNYQAYLGISLFKQCGLIDQHGRQGYSIPRPADFKEAVAAVWGKLPALRDK